MLECINVLILIILLPDYQQQAFNLCTASQYMAGYQMSTWQKINTLKSTLSTPSMLICCISISASSSSSSCGSLSGLSGLDHSPLWIVDTAVQSNKPPYMATQAIVRHSAPNSGTYHLAGHLIQSSLGS